jgi:hypothetical protein
MNPLEKQSEHQVSREEAAARSKSVTLDQIIAEPDDSRPDRDGAPPPLGTVSVGRIVAMQQEAVPLIDFPANTSGSLVQARSLVPVSQREIGREIALAFEENDPTKPLILGLLQVATSLASDGPEPQQFEVEIDEDVLTLTAKKEITLRCGKASITLTSAGKVLIRGAYLLSRSSGVNRIKGGSVQIN